MFILHKLNFHTNSLTIIFLFEIMIFYYSKSIKNSILSSIILNIYLKTNYVISTSIAYFKTNDFDYDEGIGTLFETLIFIPSNFSTAQG